MLKKFVFQNNLRPLLNCGIFVPACLSSSSNWTVAGSQAIHGSQRHNFRVRDGDGELLQVLSVPFVQEGHSAAENHVDAGFVLAKKSKGSGNN